jgi:hypothetical protein
MTADDRIAFALGRTQMLAERLADADSTRRALLIECILSDQVADDAVVRLCEADPQLASALKARREGAPQ